MGVLNCTDGRLDSNFANLHVSIRLMTLYVTKPNSVCLFVFDIRYKNQNCFSPWISIETVNLLLITFY